jgi:hypothetical protein
MRYKWFWLLAGWLMIVGLVSCSRVETSVSAETTPTLQVETAVVTGSPTTAVEPIGSSLAESSATEADLIREETPSLQSTAIPITLTQVIQEEKMMVGSSNFEALVRQAKEDLATRQGIGLDQIKLLEVREVVWPDSSLGCPEEGTNYQQVPQAGLLIRLGAGDRMYFYHGDTTQAPFLCERMVDIFKVTPKVDEMVPPPDHEID